RCPLAGASARQREPSRLRLPAALHAPGRELGAVEVGLHHAGRQYAIRLAEPQAAPEGAGAGGILPQREFLDPDRQRGLLQLERDDAGIAVRHGAERSGAIVGRAGAPAAVSAVVGAEKCPVRSLAVESDAGMGPEMAAR